MSNAERVGYHKYYQKLTIQNTIKMRVSVMFCKKKEQVNVLSLVGHVVG